MKKTSIYVDEALDSALARNAAVEGISKAELIRRTLADVARAEPDARPTVGVFDGPEDLATNPAHLKGFGR